jgi:hypothetical protein
MNRNQTQEVIHRAKGWEIVFKKIDKACRTPKTPPQTYHQNPRLATISAQVAHIRDLLAQLRRDIAEDRAQRNLDSIHRLSTTAALWVDCVRGL